MSDASTAPRTDEDDPIAALDRAAAAHADATSRVAEIGEDTLRQVANAHDRATGLLDTYEDRATGTGDFGAFVEFEERFTRLVEGLPEDLPERETFERADDRLDKRRLSESDFAAARETLDPAGDLTDRLEARREAHERHEDARRDVIARKNEIAARIEQLRDLRRLADVDLDAPVGDLKQPIEAYNEAVSDAFGTVRRETSARAVVDLLEAARAYPLVDLRPPPADLAEYVASNPAGEESITTLIEYADYSISKLDHYVDDPHELKRRIATHRSYLDRLDADPLEVAWPPPPADDLWWRGRELVSMVSRFAPPEAVTRLRTVRGLTREERYERLRKAARVREELGPEERERLEDGSVERDLEHAREERDRLQGALDEHTAD